MTPDEMVRRGNEFRARGRLARAKRLFRKAAKAGNVQGMWSYSSALRHARDHAGADEWCRRAAEHGHTGAMMSLARQRKAAGDDVGAERWYREAAGHGSVAGMVGLAALLTQRGDLAGAEESFRQAALHGSTEAKFDEPRMRRIVGSGAVDDPTASHGGGSWEPRQTLGDAVAEAWRRHRDGFGGGS
jgi:TPR repeat protein